MPSKRTSCCPLGCVFCMENKIYTNVIFSRVDGLFHIHIRYLVCEKDSQSKMSWSFIVFIAHVLTHSLSLRCSSMNVAGSCLIDSPTDSIFLPFSLIRLIIYKCCFKMVVFLALHHHFNTNVCSVWIACISICAWHTEIRAQRFFASCYAFSTQYVHTEIISSDTFKVGYEYNENGKPMVKMLRRPILNLVRMSAWTKIMAFRFQNNSAPTLFFFVHSCFILNVGHVSVVLTVIDRNVATQNQPLYRVHGAISFYMW